MLDLRNLNTAEIISDASTTCIYVGADVDEKIYFIPVYASGGGFLGNLATVPIKFNNPCFVAEDSFANYNSVLTYVLETLNIQIDNVNARTTQNLGYSVNRVYVPRDWQKDLGVGLLTSPPDNPATITFSPSNNAQSQTATGFPIITRGIFVGVGITNGGYGYDVDAPPQFILNTPEGAFPSTLIKARIYVKPVDGQSCGLPTTTFMSAVNKGLDVPNLNRFGYAPKIAYPTAAAIPLKSNISTYGPYVSTNWSNEVGGIAVETDKDIAPWVFGSVAAANSVGQARANEFNQYPLKIGEAGSVTIPGLPAVTFGSRIKNPINNTFGPYLNSININFGSNGITTNLNFQTFTPKFASLPTSTRNQIKGLVHNRQKQLQFIREQEINTLKIYKQIGSKASSSSKLKISSSQSDPKAKGSTLNRMLVGEIYDFMPLPVTGTRSIASTSQRVVVGTDKLADVQLEMREDYYRKAYMSWDGLLSPISISGGTNDNEITLPRYINAISSTKKHKASSIQPHPPFITGSNNTSIISGHNAYNLDIKNLNINPLSNPSGIPYYGNSCAGHNIDVVGRGTGVPYSGLTTNFYPESRNNEKYSNDYRFLGLRGPLVLHSWGYDVDGKPIPNAIDNEANTKNGIFISESSGIGLKDQFMDDWLQKPATWPVGPVDLRFDRERGVWVAPQPYRTVVARVTQQVAPFSSGLAAIINKDFTGNKSYGQKLYDGSGNPLTENSTCTSNNENLPIITIVDRIGNSHSIGDLVYAHYDTFNSEYIILTNTSPIKLAKAVGNWNKFAIKEVTVFKVSDPTPGESFLSNPRLNALVADTGICSTVYAINLFANIVDANEYFCVLAELSNSYHILLSAECGC